jgi:predicted membrane channel-forming protein YqfA (hemolysin III family)
MQMKLICQKSRHQPQKLSTRRLVRRQYWITSLLSGSVSFLLCIYSFISTAAFVFDGARVFRSSLVLGLTFGAAVYSVSKIAVYADTLMMKILTLLVYLIIMLEFLPQTTQITSTSTSALLISGVCSSTVGVIFLYSEMKKQRQRLGRLQKRAQKLRSQQLTHKREC